MQFLHKRLLNLACIVSLGNMALPAMAQSPGGHSPSPQPSTSSSQTVIQPENNAFRMTIPQSTGIIVSFPATVAIDAGRDEGYPITLPLAQAIRDDQGEVVIPENTPVSIMLAPQSGGVRIVAQSIVVNGRIVTIAASSPLIPGTTITHMRANDRALENGAVWGRMLGSGFGFMNNGDPDQFDRGAMLGSVIGMVSGLRSPENTRVVQIPQGSVYVLTLESPIVLN